METSTSRNFLILLAILTIMSKFTQILAIQRTTTTTTIYTDFLKTSCKTTTYPDLCYNSLLTHTSDIQTSPQLLANAALSVTLDMARTTYASISTLSKGLGVRPREAGPMRDCLEVLDDTIDQLRNSIIEMGELKDCKNFRMLISDVQTWVSAALTNEGTCMDGFGGKYMNGSLKTKIRSKIMVICHLTSNSLALINSFATLHG